MVTLLLHGVTVYLYLFTPKEVVPALKPEGCMLAACLYELLIWHCPRKGYIVIVVYAKIQCFRKSMNSRIFQVHCLRLPSIRPIFHWTTRRQPLKPWTSRKRILRWDQTTHRHLTYPVDESAGAKSWCEFLLKNLGAGLVLWVFA